MLAEALHHRAHELTKAVRGHITLGCCTILSPFFLPHLIEILATSYPEIGLHIQLGDVDSLHRWLREGTIEIGLMYDLNCDPAVYSKHPLAQLRLHALLPESHPLATKASVSPDDLIEEPLLLLNCTRSADHLLSVFRFARERPRIKHKVSDFDLVRGLVAAGKGYTILHVLPTFDRACQGYPVKWVPIEGDHRSLAVVMASMHVLKPSGRRKALIDACNAMMRDVGFEHQRMAS